MISAQREEKMGRTHGHARMQKRIYGADTASLTLCRCQLIHEKVCGVGSDGIPRNKQSYESSLSVVRSNASECGRKSTLHPPIHALYNEDVLSDRISAGKKGGPITTGKGFGWNTG